MAAASLRERGLPGVVIPPERAVVDVWWAGAGGRETGYLTHTGAVRQDAAGTR